MEIHQANPKMSQAKVAEIARREFKLDQLSQATISTVIRESKVIAANSGNLTMAQCLKIRQKSLENPKMTQKKIAEWAKQEFKMQKALSQPAISNILNDKRQISTDVPDSELKLKRPRLVRFSGLDDALASWVIGCQERGIALSWKILQKKAHLFADEFAIPENDRPTFSDGWVQKFLLRRNFKSMKPAGERGSADMEAVRAELPILQQLIARYSPADVYNMDETGLFFSMAPDRTIASRQMGGMKKDKTRLTVALCANSNGTDKRALFFIGHSEKPRCFKKKRAEELGFYYAWNKKAWMTSLLFQQWLEKFDLDMRKHQRQVLLLLDNAPTHAVRSLDLTNVSVMFLPPNTTSLIQPMDAGIIAAFKKRYRSFQLGLALDRDNIQAKDIYKVDILQAMSWCRDAWEMITSISITNCWSHTGLLDAVDPQNDDFFDSDIFDEFDAIVADQIGELSAKPVGFQEYIAQDDDFEVHQEFTEDDILGTYREDSEPDVELEAPDSRSEITLEQKISALQMSIEILCGKSLENCEIIKQLRSLLYKFCREQREQFFASLKQGDIRSYFE